ncbi:MAG: phosphogluconate dehydratase [Sphingomonadales bacterium]
MRMNKNIREVIDRIKARSGQTRQAYLERLDAMRDEGRARPRLSCGNLAHAFAACPRAEKDKLASGAVPNIAVISAYNDMLSAHQPYHAMLAEVKHAVAAAGGVAQMAGGVPAMCDGVTQGRPGMELSLFSRDVIALATALALSHDVFEGGLLLGVCDKIVPGLMIGALSFGHLPFAFIPAGPMPTGIANAEKAAVRQQYADGKLGREALLASESRAYHSPGTCTFYGTANSNQMMLELMGLQLPGSSFVPPEDPLRPALTAETARALVTTASGPRPLGLGELVDERAVVNGMTGLLATGGSTNHTLHIVAIAAAAGIKVTWRDFADLSVTAPLLARVYPNGPADVNAFHRSGGTSFVIHALLEAGLLDGDARTIMGGPLTDHAVRPVLEGHLLRFAPAPRTAGDDTILRPADSPFQPSGGLAVLKGNLGEAVIKTSAVKPAHRHVEAPAMVFDHPDDLLEAFDASELNKDFVAVIRFQGPRANGMPELHKLTPALGVLQDKGFKVALVTDGRMSGASGKVPAAIHLSPEAASGGPIARIKTGDVIRLDAESGTLDALAPLDTRPLATAPVNANTHGRDLFAPLRQIVGAAGAGGSIFNGLDDETGGGS